MKKHRLYFTIALVIFIMKGISFAQPPALLNGLAWLNSAQLPNGSWDSVNATTDTITTTSSVMNSLSLLNNSGTQNYVNGATWLTAQQIEPTRSLAERLSILPNSTADKDAILLYLDDLARVWGGYDDFTVTNLDTALALQALKAANYSDSVVLFSAINFLTTNQNSDGGWGFRPAVLTGFPQTVVIEADPSSAYVTSMVLRALSAYNSQFIVQTNINNAKAYLLTKQNTDGGFGSSPSNVYETALSVMSLIESSQSDILPLQNAINYLTTAQLPNGSWENDPYQTALALQALAAARPNLSLSSISLSKSMPQAGEEVTITATVTNTGLNFLGSGLLNWCQPLFLMMLHTVET